jgi:ICP0-binding domain of Ubiquitin-specific protease 7
MVVTSQIPFLVLNILVQPLDNNSIMIFLKHFSVNEQTLKGVGKVYVQRNSKVGDLVSTINMKMGWASTTPIRLFEVRLSLCL